MPKLKVSADTPTFTRTYIFMALCLINHHLNFISLQSANHPFPVAQTGQRSVFITACSFWSEDQRRSCSGFKFGSLPSAFIGFIDTGWRGYSACFIDTGWRGYIACFIDTGWRGYIAYFFRSARQISGYLEC